MVTSDSQKSRWQWPNPNSRLQNGSPQTSGWHRGCYITLIHNTWILHYIHNNYTINVPDPSGLATPLMPESATFSLFFIALKNNSVHQQQNKHTDFFHYSLLFFDTCSVNTLHSQNLNVINYTCASFAITCQDFFCEKAVKACLNNILFPKAFHIFGEMFHW